MSRGSIEQRSPGTWSIRVELPCDPITGKRRQRRATVRGKKSEAEIRLSEILHEIDNHSYIHPRKITLGQYLNQWVRDYAWPNLAPKTAQNYDHMINKHLLPSLGSIPLSDLQAESIQKYITDKLYSGLSPKTVRHHYVTLHTALAHAVKQRRLARNPCSGVTPPKQERTELKVLDEQGVHLLLDAAHSTKYYSIFYFLLYTGCRRSEALAIRWQDIDLTLCQVSINRSLHHLRDGRIVFRQPKTSRSRRLIPLPPSAAIVLKQHKEDQRELQAGLEIPLSDNDLVFCHPDGKPYLPDSVTNAWTQLVRRIGLAGVRLHDARHTHATLMMKQGTNPKVVQERLGHSSIAVTIDTYSHVVPGIQEAAALRFDEGLNKSPLQQLQPA